MELSGDKKSTRIHLGISFLFFHIIRRLVQEIVMYDNIFRSLEVGDVLLQKRFLEIGSYNVARWKSRASEMFGTLRKHFQGRRFPRPGDETAKAEVQKWLREQDISFHCQGAGKYRALSHVLEQVWGLCGQVED
jgi:hypothetical protein